MSFLRYSTRKNIATWNPGQGSIKVIESGIIRYSGYGFLLAFNGNVVPKTGLGDIRLQMCRNLENRVMVPSRSLKISPFDRAHIYDFPLTFHSNSGPISYRFRDRRRFQSKIATTKNSTSPFVVFCTPVEEVPFGIGYRRLGSKTRMMGLPADKEVWRHLQPSGYNAPTWQTDRRTPGDSKDRAYA